MLATMIGTMLVGTLIGTMVATSFGIMLKYMIRKGQNHRWLSDKLKFQNFGVSLLIMICRYNYISYLQRPVSQKKSQITKTRKPTTVQFANVL